MNDQEWLLKEKYRGVESEAFHADSARLQAGEPLGYIIGHVPFLGCAIYLDSHPLIPRPETEYWTEQAIAKINESGIEAPKVLDLCAGSGAIGVAVAHHLPSAHVTFAELDKAHLPTIGKNLETNQIACTEYQVFQSDLFSDIAGQFDFILSNPPYIDPALDRTEESVKEHEPAVALYGGQDGLELIFTIIDGSKKYLTPAGQLWLEHEPEQAAAIILHSQKDFTCQVALDQYGVARYSILTLKKPTDMAQ